MRRRNAPPGESTVKALLSVQISVDYRQKTGVLRDVEFEIGPGEIAGFVGQSGSGKSTLALALLGLLDRRNAAVSGYAHFAGQNLLRLNERELRRVRGREIGLVLQAASSALNPHLRLCTQFKHAWKAHGIGEWEEQKPAVFDLLSRLDLPADEPFLRRYGSEISIGQAQRVLVAMAVLHRPKLLILDEPTSALDVLAQVELLELLRTLNQDLQMAMIYISHDLATVASLCHRVCILQSGAIVESGSPARIFSSAQHPLTRQLVAAMQLLEGGLVVK